MLYICKKESHAGIKVLLFPYIFSLSIISFHTLALKLTFSLNSCSVDRSRLPHNYLTTTFTASTRYFRSTEERALPACSLNFPRIPILVAVNTSFQPMLWVNQSQVDVTTDQEMVPTIA